MRNGRGTFCVLKFVELDVQLKLAEAYWEFVHLQWTSNEDAVGLRLDRKILQSILGHVRGIDKACLVCICDFLSFILLRFHHIVNVVK
ncbi:hypothetical protein ACSBR2_007520 [Camellia fascicularis]